MHTGGALKSPLSITVSLLVCAAATACSDGRGAARANDGQVLAPDGGTTAGDGDAGAGAMGDDGGTAPGDGDGGDGDGGGDPPGAPPVPPTPEAQATCNHPPAPRGFEPRAAVVIHGSINHVVAVADDGAYVDLGCDGVEDPRRIFASPGGGELMVLTGGQPFTTSWYVDGVYGLPMDVDGFSLSDHRWVADDWIVALGTRADPGTGEALEYAPYLMRWDGARLHRAPGRIDVDNRPLRLPFGATDRFGIIRVGPTPDNTIDHVRIRLSDGDATVMSSDIGGTWVRMDSGVNRESGNFLIVGDGMGIDRIYLANADTGTVVESGSHAFTSITMTPDGTHAVWPVGGGGLGFRSLAFDSPQQSRDHTGLDYGALIRMEPRGHRFLALTQDGQAAMVDPATGRQVVPINPPVAAGAAGVASVVFANDRTGAYVLGTFDVGGEPALYFDDFAGRATPIDLAKQPAPNDVRLQQTQDGRRMAHRTPDGWQLLDRNGPPTPIPGLVPERTHIAHAFEGELLLVQSRDPSGDTPVRLYAWQVGDASIVDLLAGATAALQGTHEQLDSLVVTYPYEPPQGF